MAEDSRPWQGTTIGDSGPYSSADWQTTWKHMIGFGAESANVGVIRGVLNGLNVIPATPNDNTVILQSGAALVQGIWYLNDTNLVLTIANNGTANNRYDTVVLEALYTGTQTVRARIVQGVAAASPLRPSLTQNAGVQWQIPIADILVAPGSPPTIAVTDIGQRQSYANITDRVEVDVTNSSGAELITGDLVIWDTSADASVTTVASLDQEAAGVVETYIGVGGSGRIVTHGICYVRSVVGTLRGQFLTTSATAGLCQAATQNFFGMALTDESDGYVLAYVNFLNRIVHYNFATASVDNVATTSGAFTTITGTSLTFTKQYNQSQIKYSIFGYQQVTGANGTGTIRIYDVTNGVQIGNYSPHTATANEFGTVACGYVATGVPLVAGSYTIRGEFNVTGGATVTVFQLQIVVEEVFVS